MKEKIRFARSDEVAEKHKELLASLPVGEHHAVSMSILADALNMKPAELREYVLRARIDGCFILSGQYGYYLPESAEDIRHYAVQRSQFIKTARKAIAPFLRELSRHGLHWSVRA